MMCGTTLLIIVAVIAPTAVFVNAEEESPVPIVLWHGMGSSSSAVELYKKGLEQEIPGVYVHNLRIGSNATNEEENSYFLHPDKQIEEACQLISEDQNLANGYNAIGFSQGAQFMRGLLQRCPYPQMKNFISLGGQHQGVYGYPNCDALTNSTCDYVRKLLNHAAYASFVQHLLVQATYWHDPLHENTYRNSSTFLADINNEQTINPAYIQNIQSLNNFVMVKFERDGMVQPTESSWFGFYKPGQSVEVESLEESNLFTEDRLGLQKLKEEGKLHFLSRPGDHLVFDWAWFSDSIIKPFLSS